MTFFSGGGSQGAQFAQSASKTDILGRKYAPFANPFFDQADTYTPASVKSLFGFCRFYHLTHGIINAIGTKASEYPITDLILQHSSKSVVERWKELMLGDLNYRVHQFEVNLDYFCFAAETPVVTRHGTFPIEDLRGRTVEVLSEEGKWRKASFEPYGVQKLYKIEFSRGEVLYATAEHQWPIIDTNGRKHTVPTTDLVGKYLQRNAASRPERNEDYQKGLRHGIVFGDGTLSNERKQAHVVFYSSGKKRELIRFFEGYVCTEHHEGKYIAAYGLPPGYKELPPISATNSYWYGFVCGLLATDGSIDDNGQTNLHQKLARGLDVVAAQLPRFGMIVRPPYVYTADTSFGVCEMERVALTTAFMQVDDFVRSDQRDRYMAAYGDEISTYGLKSKVKAVTPTDRIEEVYCCVEPDTHTFTVGNGVLTGNCYGNAFVSPSFPFRKKIICASCQAEHDAIQTRKFWRYTNFRFWLTCPKCGQSDFAKSRDDYYAKPSEIGLIRWNPENITIFYNESTGRLDYALDLSSQFRSEIQLGRKDLIATTPEIFLQAAKDKRMLVFDKREVFHMRRPSLSSQHRGWGPPLLMPVLKDAFYMQIMKKAQECVSPNTLIDTSTGLVMADEVQPGTLVRTRSGAYHPVVARTDRAVRDGERAYEIRVSGLRELPSVFSETHPIWVIRRTNEVRRVDTKDRQRSSVILRKPHLYNFQMVQAQDIQPGDYVGFPTTRMREEHILDLAQYGQWKSVTDDYVYLNASQDLANEFEGGGIGPLHTAARKITRTYLAGGKEPKRVCRFVELDIDLAYVAGWYAGDGCSSDRTVTFCMGPDDDGIELQEAIQRVFPFTTFSTYGDPKSRGWTFRVYGSAFARFMSAWLPGKAQTKRVPEEIRSSPDDVVAAFLRGYVEADGCDRGVRVSTGTASKQLAYDVWSLGISLGCIATLATRQCYDTTITNALGEKQELKANGRVHHYVTWSNRSAERLRAQMYEKDDVPEVISGKSGFFFEGQFAARVLSVEEVECERVIDFEVEHDHSFCVPGFAVHNSVLLTHMLPQIFLYPQPATAGADPFCVTPDTMIETMNGLCPAAEVQEGDYLRSHTGLWRRVEGCLARDVSRDEKVYRITARTLPAFPFKISEEHPILASKNMQKRSGRGFDPTALPDPEFIEAKNLAVGDFVAYPTQRKIRSSMQLDLAELCPDLVSTENWIYLRYNNEGAEIYEYLEQYGVPTFKPGPQALLEQFLCDKGWSRAQYDSVRAGHEAHRHPRYIELNQDWSTVIGYYLSEGCTTEHVASFAFHPKETHFTDELQTALEAIGFHSVIDVTSSRVVRVNSIILAKLLRALCGRYSAQKYIPAIMSEAPRDMCFNMIRCLYNGDGCFIVADKRGTKRVSLKTTSPNLALETRRLLLSFGYIGGVSRAVPAEGEIAKQPYYQVYYNGAVGNDLAQCFGWEGYGEPSKRTERNAFIRGDYLFMRIAEVEVVEEPVVIGFQMAGDRSFCVAGVATHNTTVNLHDWRSHIQRELARQRMDPSYYGILPFPLGHQIIGENGRSLLLMQEIRMMGEMICVGMGFPPDLVFGQGTYAGTSVSMRMLENFFLSNVQSQYRLLHWYMKRISSFLNWPLAEGRFKPFKMADDLQRQAFAFQLNQASKISDTTLLSLADFKVEDESALQVSEAVSRQDALKRQQLLMAEVQGEAGVVSARFQAKAQEVMMEAQRQAQQSAQEAANASGQGEDGPAGAGGGNGSAFTASQGSGLGGASSGLPLNQVAAGIAHQLAGMPPEMQQQQLAQIKKTQPELGELVQQNIISPAARPTGVDMRPMPNVLPPRRASLS